MYLRSNRKRAVQEQALPTACGTIMTDKEAFSGIRVLDFSQGIAGPHSAMLLAQHGADVIKAEPITGDWGRTLGRSYGQNTAHSIAFNRGKRSIALDLTKPRGLEVRTS